MQTREIVYANGYILHFFYGYIFFFFFCSLQRSEREKLTVERIKLNQMKLKTWQSYSGLYERVCAEASLKPEQLQVLAKYSSPDCPLSAFLCSSPDSHPAQASDLSTHTCCSGAKPPVHSSMENTTAQSSSQNLLPLGGVEAQSHTCPPDASAFETSECRSVVKLSTDLLSSKHETNK